MFRAPLNLSMVALLWVDIEGWGTKEEVSGSVGCGCGPELGWSAAGGELGDGRSAGCWRARRAWSIWRRAGCV